MGPHSHGHGHHPRRSLGARRSLGIAFGITLVFMLVEMAGAYVSGSLALLADAGHMLTDVSSLGIALAANWFSSRAATRKRSYGWQRLEIVAAFLNGLALLGVAFFIASKAVERFRDPPQVSGTIMLAVAVAGLAANMASALVLFRESGGNLNVKAAFFHVVSDMLGSVGAILAGILVAARGWMLADPIIGVFISVLVLVSAWSLIRESLSVLLQSTPPHIDLEHLLADIRAVEGVTKVHDLHVWTMTSGYFVLTAHVVIGADVDGDDVLHRLNEMFLESWGISHTTVQIERTSREVHDAVRHHYE